TDRQIISQRTPIGVDRSWSQAQLNLKLEPGRRHRMPSNGWPAPGRLGVFHAPEVIHGIHREGSLPRRPLLPRDCYGCGYFHPISLSFPFLITFPSPRGRPPRHENGGYPERLTLWDERRPGLCWCSKPAITLARVA